MFSCGWLPPIGDMNEADMGLVGFAAMNVVNNDGSASTLSFGFGSFAILDDAIIGCVWLGRMATRRQLAWSYALWGGILLIGGTAAAAYKTLPCAQPVITSQPRSIMTRRGQSVTLTVHVVGEDLSYQWFGGASRFMGAPIRGGTQPALRVSPAVTSSYWLRASDACGHVDSATALITVK